MLALLGLLKVGAILILDFFLLRSLFGLETALIITAVIAAYTCFGGYLALLKDGAVSAKKLPVCDRERLADAVQRLAADARQNSGAKLSRLRLYLVPGDADMNATAYGANCVSVTEGTFCTADPATLLAVLAHEGSHILHRDAETNRAVFASVTLLMAALSVCSAAVAVIVFLIFLLLNCFRSFLGVLAFKGMTKVSGGFFRLLQRGIVFVYRSTMALVSRGAEYRADRYACRLGYGLQLGHFLEIAGADESAPRTLTDAIYRNHPPTPRRLARIEQQLLPAAGAD